VLEADKLYQNAEKKASRISTQKPLQEVALTSDTGAHVWKRSSSDLFGQRQQRPGALLRSPSLRQWELLGSGQRCRSQVANNVNGRVTTMRTQRERSIAMDARALAQPLRTYSLVFRRYVAAVEAITCVTLNLGGTTIIRFLRNPLIQFPIDYQSALWLFFYHGIGY
jgi:hypothetical protein